VDEKLTWAFVGSIVPDREEFHTVAFSRAGQMAQQSLLLGMKHAGMPPSAVFVAEPVPSFPRGRRLWARGGRAALAEGMEATFLRFVNIVPLKHLTGGLAALWHILRWARRTRGAARRLVYTYNLSFPPALFTWLGAKLVGAKAVAMVYDIEIPRQTVPWSIGRSIDLWLHGFLLPRFDGRVLIADAIADDFAPGKPYLCVEGGIRPEVLAGGGSAPVARPPDGPFTVVSAGSLDEVNGFPLLLQAFARLPGDGYRLRIAGRGPLEPQVRSAAAKDPRIEYLGFLSFEEVQALYRSADVLVNMRLTRAINTRYFFPSKLMEYLASAVPVISTCTGAVEKEFGSFVHLLREETPQSLADAIREMAALDARARVDMGRRARQYLMAHKTWDAQARKIVQYLQSV
jgi:glycosyltransferase involved in cell wall biosynthesis